MSPKDNELANPATLRDLRSAFDLTQKELAIALGITWQTVSRWERGDQPIRHPRLLFLALEALARRLAGQHSGRRVRTAA